MRDFEEISLIEIKMERSMFYSNVSVKASES